MTIELLKKKITKLWNLELKYIALSEEVNSAVNSGTYNDNEIDQLCSFIASLRKK